MSYNRPSTTLLLAIAGLWPGLAWSAADAVMNWNNIAVQTTLAAGQNGITQSRSLAIIPNRGSRRTELDRGPLPAVCTDC
jgi:hypothetical protein